ncbi:MAG: cation:proton antiporter, partial [Steroidobacteraceae bacterium]
MPDSPLLLLQLLVILTTARACGMAVRRLGQPAVIGEMVAGILLGPIVLGAWSPQFHAALFPEESLGALNALGQFGMVLFMFIVGVE